MNDSQKDRLKKDRHLKVKAHEEIQKLLIAAKAAPVDQRKLEVGLQEVRRYLTDMDFFDSE